MVSDDQRGITAGEYERLLKEAAYGPGWVERFKEFTLKPMYCVQELQDVLEDLRGYISHESCPDQDTKRRWESRLRAVQTHIGIYGPNVHDYWKEVQMSNGYQTIMQPKPEKMELCGPPLKTLVAEYLMEIYRTYQEFARGDDEPTFEDTFNVLTDFLSWSEAQEKRSRPPAITTIPEQGIWARHSDVIP